jgi:hypothetical protein
VPTDNLSGGVVTKGVAVLAVIVGFVLWANAGFPFWTVTINRGR